MTPALQALIDKQALHELCVTYSRAIDRRDFALLESLYAPEAHDDHGAMFAGGTKAYVAFVAGALAAYERTVHYVTQTAFVIAGDTAEGEVHKINFHRTASHDIVTGSRSLDRYIRRDGRWLFLSRHVVNDWAQKRAVDPADQDDFAAQAPRGAAGGEDPSYRLLAGFARHSHDLWGERR